MIHLPLHFAGSRYCVGKHPRILCGLLYLHKKKQEKKIWRVCQRI